MVHVRMADQDRNPRSPSPQGIKTGETDAGPAVQDQAIPSLPDTDTRGIAAIPERRRTRRRDRAPRPEKTDRD